MINWPTDYFILYSSYRILFQNILIWIFSFTDLNILPIPMMLDNYAYLVTDLKSQKSVLIDPGHAAAAEVKSLETLILLKSQLPSSFNSNPRLIRNWWRHIFISNLLNLKFTKFLDFIHSKGQGSKLIIVK